MIIQAGSIGAAGHQATDSLFLISHWCITQSGQGEAGMN